ncbi:PREDICTED: lysine-rich arabinogalactan protein 19-like, partial [Nipponia nippon]
MSAPSSPRVFAPSSSSPHISPDPAPPAHASPPRPAPPAHASPPG